MADDTALDLDALTPWLAERVQITAPLSATLISGGRSNLTYKVTDADDLAFVVRRPPLGDLLPGAHDMGREYSAMDALAGTDVPVPTLVGLEADGDTSPIGVPFYAMRFVEGKIVRTLEQAQALQMETRRAAAQSLASTMAKLHAVDPESVGLGPASKGENYVARQLHVWRRQLDMCVLREVPILREVHERLVERIPPQQATAIVHGDYRLDNVMITPDGEVNAVLDWELRTLGDPLADVGITMVYWGHPDEPAAIPRPTDAEGFGSREDFLAAYVAAGGREMPAEHLGFYLAFGTWRLAAILEGVYQRNLSGAYGESDDAETPSDVQQFEATVPEMGQIAAGFLQ